MANGFDFHRLLKMNEECLEESKSALKALKAGEIKTYAGNIETTKQSIELQERVIASLTDHIGWIRKRIEDGKS